MAIVSADEYYKRFMDQYQPSITNAVNQSNAAYKGQADTISQIYQQQIDQQGQQYNDLLRENEVQKYINQRNITENMANMGLTDSGLNRTQQTAVQLSAANNRDRIEVQRQNAVDALTQAMTAKLADIESARSSAEMGIRQNYENMATTAANNAYKADVENARKIEEARIKAEQELLKAQINASAKASSGSSGGTTGNTNIINAKGATLNRNFSGTLADNGVTTIKLANGKIRYTDSVTGYSTDVKATVNPFTGDDNADLISIYGAYSNGYQPKGDSKHGKILKSVGEWTSDDGRTQKVWLAEDGSYLFWNGATNSYDVLNFNGILYDKNQARKRRS